jgi:hypothetical protein
MSLSILVCLEEILRASEIHDSLTHVSSAFMSLSILVCLEEILRASEISPLDAKHVYPSWATQSHQTFSFSDIRRVVACHQVSVPRSMDGTPAGLFSEQLSLLGSRYQKQ